MTDLLTLSAAGVAALGILAAGLSVLYYARVNLSRRNVNDMARILLALQNVSSSTGSVGGLRGEDPPRPKTDGNGSRASNPPAEVVRAISIIGESRDVPEVSKALSVLRESGTGPDADAAIREALSMRSYSALEHALVTLSAQKIEQNDRRAVLTYAAIGFAVAGVGLFAGLATASRGSGQAALIGAALAGLVLVLALVPLLIDTWSHRAG